MPVALKSWLVLLSLLLPALLLGLGERPLSKIQEVRVAETAREMLASGDYLVPRYNGELRLQKPPLPYWLAAAAYQVGGVNLWAVRLPAAVFGLLAAGLMFLWCQRQLGLRVAAQVVVILVTSFIGLRYFRSGEADAPLLFFIAAACLTGYAILHGEGRRSLVLLFFTALGLGFAIKGPAALAIPLVTLLAAAVYERKLASLKALYSPLGWMLLLVLAGGWYALLLWQMPEAAQSFVGKQVDETFLSGTHAKPVWWYLVHVFDFFAPWSALLIPAAWSLYRLRPLPPPVRYALVWLAVVFVLLMATVNKQMQYALLLAPPLAIVLGYYMSGLQLPLRWRLIGLSMLALSVLALPVMAYLQQPQDGMLALLWPLVALAPLLVQKLLRDESAGKGVLLVAGVMVAAFLYLEKYDSDVRKIQVPELMAQAADYRPLYQLTPGDGAVSYYAGRVVPPVAAGDLPALAAKEREIWVVTRKGQALNVGSKVITSGEMALWRVSSQP